MRLQAFPPKSNVGRVVWPRGEADVTVTAGQRLREAFFRELRSTLEWGPRVQGGLFKEPSGE